MKFRENYDFRRLDFAYPRAAVNAVADVEMKYIKAGIPTRSIQSGPMMLDFPKFSGLMSHRIMLVDSAHADAFIAELEEAVAPYDLPDEDYGNFGKEPEEDDE